MIFKNTYYKIARFIFMCFMLSVPAGDVYAEKTSHQTGSYKEIEDPELPQDVCLRYTTGVLDRFEGNNQAVLLLESLRKEIVISRDKLPDGTRVKTWFDVWLGEKGEKFLFINKEKTEQEKAHAEKLRKEVKSLNSMQ